LSSGHAPWWFEYGGVLMDLGRLDDAERATRRALELTPEAESYHLALGVLLLKRGLREAAIAEMQRELRLHPQNAMAKQWLAQTTGIKEPEGPPKPRPGGDF
jgi:tetratricopeptide (TPR) repeat protein